MKTIKLLLSGLLLLTPFLGNSQEWDEIYANPNKQEIKIVQKKKPQQKQKIVVIQGNASNVEVEANGRNLDEYNRRGGNDSIDNRQATVDEYTDYEYTDRIIKYHDPESSVKITGADEVTIYVGDDLYSEYYENRGFNYNVNIGWGGFYPWYDSWNSPYSYGFNSPWSFGFGYSGFYDPWYYGGYYGGYSPWGYSGWYSPFYYSSWRNPWQYGGYYGGGYGYNNGYYDGYYSGIANNRSGRSTGTYRTSNSGRSTVSGVGGRTSGSNRSSLARSSESGRSAGTYSRSAETSRSSSLNREGTSGSRTRIIDNSGNVIDSRSGRTINRSSEVNRGDVGRPSNANTITRSGANSTSSRVYERSTSPVQSSRSSGGVNRGVSSRSNTSATQRSGIYSTPSRSNNTGTYQAPTRTVERSSSTPTRSSSSSSSTYSSPSRSSSSSSGSTGGGSSRSSSSSSSSRSSGGRR
ncbi:MAG: hypothetical protein ACOH2V_10250 [Candidatus Saccharimonadaceae bacterium]